MKKVINYIGSFLLVSGILALGGTGGYFLRPYIEGIRSIERTSKEEYREEFEERRSEIPGMQFSVEDFVLRTRNGIINIRAKHNRRLYEIVAEPDRSDETKTKISVYSNEFGDLVMNDPKLE